MPSQAAIAKMQKDRNTALRSASKARADTKVAEASTKEAKADKRNALREQAKQFGLLLLLAALGVSGGLVIGGQLTRIVDPETKAPSKWVGRGQWLSFGAGLVMLVAARDCGSTS